MSFLVNPYRFASGTPSFSFNNCLLFDGVDDYVEWTPTEVTGAYSISLWVYFNDTTTNQVIISAGVNYYLRAGTDGSDISTFRMRHATTGANYLFTPSSVLTSGNWYHIAVSYDGVSDLVLKVNNVHANESPRTDATVAPSTGNVNGLKWLGRRSAGEYFNGRLDEVGYWLGYEFSDADISTLYNSGNGASCVDVASGSLAVHYKLDESGTDTTAVDDSGNSRDGTLNNFPTSGMWIDHFAP